MQGYNEAARHSDDTFTCGFQLATRQHEAVMEDTSARFRKAYQFIIDDEAEAERQEALDEQGGSSTLPLAVQTHGPAKNSKDV